MHAIGPSMHTMNPCSDPAHQCHKPCTAQYFNETLPHVVFVVLLAS